MVAVAAASVARPSGEERRQPAGRRGRGLPRFAPPPAGRDRPPLLGPFPPPGRAEPGESPPGGCGVTGGSGVAFMAGEPLRRSPACPLLLAPGGGLSPPFLGLGYSRGGPFLGAPSHGLRGPTKCMGASPGAGVTPTPPPRGCNLVSATLSPNQQHQKNGGIYKSPYLFSSLMLRVQMASRGAEVWRGGRTAREGRRGMSKEEVMFATEISVGKRERAVIALPANTPLTHDTENCRGLGTFPLVA
ncbi:proline-rich protein 2-like isoform X2 [Rissa tridactyla]|uniref:proline-rich protein 2-like isoform X2 n=1 Tax=Rissa tridactyla TaxID=75485 RepID=UPI0023BB1B2F|nr:proline-rich protein 2-like isoform X2 [Rissa tridactyla]